MVSYSDKEYIESKAIKKGLKKLDSPFSDLANWINDNFGVKPLNIVYDILEHNKQPRLQVIFEKYKDNISFKTENSLFQNPDRQLMIQNAFRDLIHNHSEFTADNLYVIFSSFEPIAKEEANGKINNQKLYKLKENLKEQQIWEIKRNFSTGIFFFFTNEQLEKNDNNETKNKFKSEYLKLIKECDEFDYINDSTFSIKLDSKENFDKNYQSNWFYYYKDN
ncbi:hypothetical protein EOD40_06515 [Flavobacterium sufflavum]|uniref:Uncharacterized protein n=1 Tax=Flavobacterium sufflavum TaxID=1921138 RepID=A0A3S2WEQ6_9FLAO|nr:hypothetical protein [Flavobacterium sufflavum]RVT77454.1 hypothetical protein EOD40_06515 [Flavobacterium sufflavum]